MNISYESSDLIQEIEADIKEFGQDPEVYIWCRISEDCLLVTNYDFPVEDDSFSREELAEGEFLAMLPLGKAHSLLVEQHKVNPVLPVKLSKYASNHDLSVEKAQEKCVAGNGPDFLVLGDQWFVCE